MATLHTLYTMRNGRYQATAESACATKELVMEKELLSVEDVARRLNVRPSTVRAGVKKGVIPAVVLWQGKRRSLVRFEPEAIERLIRERTTRAQSS